LHCTYQFSEDVLRWQEKRFVIKIGKLKVPFGRSREKSGRRFQCMERRTFNLFFDVNRSIQVGLFGQSAL
jgi:hypothetical protein